jgi:hypothetical protein
MPLSNCMTAMFAGVIVAVDGGSLLLYAMV